MGWTKKQNQRKGLFAIDELQELVAIDGLGTTVAYGVAPEHIQDEELRNLWTLGQTYLLKIQDYLDARDK